MTTDPLAFAQEALGCREHRDYNTCIEHGGPTWPCPEAVRVAALIETRDRAIRADECEKAATEWLATEPQRSTYAHVRFFAKALRERAAQHRGDKP